MIIKIDWTDEKSVVGFAVYLRDRNPKCGPQIIYKHPDRPNYNIVHKHNPRAQRVQKNWIVCTIP